MEDAVVGMGSGAVTIVFDPFDEGKLVDEVAEGVGLGVVCPDAACVERVERVESVEGVQALASSRSKPSDEKDERARGIRVCRAKRNVLCRRNAA